MPLWLRVGQARAATKVAISRMLSKTREGTAPSRRSACRSVQGSRSDCSIPSDDALAQRDPVLRDDLARDGPVLDPVDERRRRSLGLAARDLVEGAHTRVLARASVLLGAGDALVGD